MVTEGNIHKPQVYEKLVAGEVQYFICYALYLAVFFHAVTYFLLFLISNSSAALL